jgi:hypothetical protein
MPGQIIEPGQSGVVMGVPKEEHHHHHHPQDNQGPRRYEGLHALRDPDKRDRVIGYVHFETMTVFDEKSRFSNPLKWSRKEGRNVPNPKHVRRIELAQEKLQTLANGLEDA